MNEQQDTKQNLKEFFKVFATGTALKLWLFLLFSFFFLGYPVVLSILLGAAGGFAGGWVHGWWKSKDEPSDVKPADIKPSEDFEASVTKMRGLRLAKQQRDAKTKNSSFSFLRPFTRFYPKTEKSRKGSSEE